MQYIYQKKLDKACFQHGMAYEDFKDLTRRKAFHELFSENAFNIAKILKDYGYQRILASVVYKFFDKKKLLVVLLETKTWQTKN